MHMPFRFEIDMRAFGRGWVVGAMSLIEVDKYFLEFWNSSDGALHFAC